MLLFSWTKVTYNNDDAKNPGFCGCFWRIFSLFKNPRCKDEKVTPQQNVSRKKDDFNYFTKENHSVAEDKSKIEFTGTSGSESNSGSSSEETLESEEESTETDESATGSDTEDSSTSREDFSSPNSLRLMKNTGNLVGNSKDNYI